MVEGRYFRHECRVAGRLLARGGRRRGGHKPVFFYGGLRYPRAAENSGRQIGTGLRRGPFRTRPARRNMLLLPYEWGVGARHPHRKTASFGTFSPVCFTRAGQLGMGGGFFVFFLGWGDREAASWKKRFAPSKGGYQVKFPGGTRAGLCFEHVLSVTASPSLFKSKGRLLIH